MNAICFFSSSLGDTDLAIDTARCLATKEIPTLLIALTSTARDRIMEADLPSTVLKNTLSDILGLGSSFSELPCSDAQIEQIAAFVQERGISRVYIGTPSTDSEVPFQIAHVLAKQKRMIVFIAYEFMFKAPDSHSIWRNQAVLSSFSNVHWALPLLKARLDFSLISDEKICIIGHRSIDKSKSLPAFSKSAEAYRDDLEVRPGGSLTFVSSTTQPSAVDATFLDSLLQYLPEHPTIQLRLGLHPGILDLEAYLEKILSVYLKHEARVAEQFKIILPDTMRTKLKVEFCALSVFLVVNVKGAEAAFAADRVAQAVSGALLNQAALEGKPAYTGDGQSYLPPEYFSSSLPLFYLAYPQAPRHASDLGLNDRTAAENCANLLLREYPG